MRRRRWCRRVLAIILACIVVTGLFLLLSLRIWPGGGAYRTVQAKYVWVQMLPDEPGLPAGRLVRAIVTEGDRCPTAVQNGKYLEMDRRPSPLRSAFPVLICQAKLEGTSDAWVGTHRLPSRPSDPQDIVVVGDTGCRMVHYDTAPQPCLNPIKWPFAATAANAAAAIARTPAIAIHVGDFHYRENPCADSSKECGGSPFGDTWATWEEEFFRPAGPLLLAAPWVMTRGNHENCARAGAGWLFFFALPDQDLDRACKHDLPSYRLSIGKTADGSRSRVLVVLDTAFEDDAYTVEARCREFGKWIADVERIDAEVWLALHHPLWSRNPDGTQESGPKAGPCRNHTTKSALPTLRARFDEPGSKRLARLVLSGHLHVFQYFQPRDSTRPIQLVAGNGGTKLDDIEPLVPTGSSEGAAPKPAGSRRDVHEDPALNSHGVDGSALTIARHGFVTLRREQWTWSARLHDKDGQTIASCRFSEADDARRSDPGPDCPIKPSREEQPRSDRAAPASAFASVRW